MDRYIEKAINELMDSKIILIMGPRQVGKTTLSKSLNKSFVYHNYDIRKDLTVFRDQEWDRSKEVVIFDEIHKMKNWKRWLKGLYDEGLTKKQHIVVTGSARLDIAKKMGDSLAGRFFSFRLNPLDLKELGKYGTPEENYQKLISVSGFPEPFLNGTERFYNLWRKTHSDLIIRQDLLTLENIKDIDGIELLVELLAGQVGSTVSYNSLAKEIQRDDKTIKKWLGFLEQMYIVFRVSPYAKNISRGTKKAGKYYFYDCARVDGPESQKLENMVALSLKKEIEFQSDCNGIQGDLFFVQTKDKKEIDFVVIQKNKKIRLIEVKLSDENISKNFTFFEKYFPRAEKIQLVKNLKKEYLSKDGVRVTSALDYLTHFEFS